MEREHELKGRVGWGGGGGVGEVSMRSDRNIFCMYVWSYF